MATLAPPPGKTPPAAKPPGKKEAAAAAPDLRPWMDRLTRSGYLLGAIVLHLLVFLIVATWVVFQAPKPPVEDFNKTYVPSGAPPPPPPQPVTETMHVPTPTAAPTVIQSSSAMPSFNVPLPPINPTQVLDNAAQKMEKLVPKLSNNLPARLSAIRQTVTKWGRDASNIRNSNGDPHNVIATFPLYLASYADGDWDCNNEVTDGSITAGSLPDLVAKINEWSHGNLKGKVVPTPLDVGSPDLLDKMPPFIFFTGHKDFHLTQPEIDNLAKYLQNGGAIWGDNALAGKGSRFDVAFKREMKKVIPDVDKNFEDIPLTHEVYTKSWYTLSKVPQGMNYYDEPLQKIDIDGKLAVLYTPNDYSDLYYMRILPGDQEMAPYYVLPGSPLHSSRQMWEGAKIFFRNWTLPSSLDAHRLGMNIIGFLLVRFDKDLILQN